jgi:hypothetical protein
MSKEPAQITGTDPGSGPDRSRCTTHSQMSAARRIHGSHGSLLKDSELGIAIQPSS